MMRTVLMSIHPKWAQKILSGEKLWELRKTAPKQNDYPLRVLLYETKPGAGAVTGEFICDAIGQEEGEKLARWHQELTRKDGVSRRKNAMDLMELYQLSRMAAESCLSPGEITKYVGAGRLYAWHVQAAIRFEEPRPLSEYGLTRPPQS